MSDEFITMREIMMLDLKDLKRERDEAREAAAKWESSSDAMERAGAEQARRADENREWAVSAELERDEAREALREIQAAAWKTSGELRGMARKALEVKQ